MTNATFIRRFVNWRSFLWAGLLANIAKFIVFYLTGNDPLANGAGLLPNASPLLQNLLGVLIFMAIGQIFYALVYVLIIHNASGFAATEPLNGIMKAVVATFFQIYLGFLAMPWIFNLHFVGPDPSNPTQTVDLNLVPWDWGDFWLRFPIYFVYSLVMVFVYKSPAEKQAQQAAAWLPNKP